MGHVAISHRGVPHAVDFDATTTIHDIKKHIRDLTGVPVEMQKLIYKGILKDNTRVDSLGLKAGDKIIMMGTHAKEVARLHDIETRAQVAKQNYAKCAVSLSSLPQSPVTHAKYTFHDIETLPGFADRQEAHKLLQRLARDVGISAILVKHQWSIGVLAEMSPAERHILGYNQNKGQRIALRLRTDDLRSFRPYDLLRKVLLHELVHMVWSEHDANFHQLHRQLNKEVVELDWRSQGGKAVFEDNGDAVDRPVIPTYEGGSYVLGGDTRLDEQLSPRELRARAAILRLTTEEKQLQDMCGPPPKEP